MSMDEGQLKKAELKIQAALSLINSLYNINMLYGNGDISEYNEMKPYEINLKYANYGEYYKFFITIYKGNNKPEEMFKIKFSLYNVDKGLDLFGKLINEFTKNELVYSAFQKPISSERFDQFVIRAKNDILLTMNIQNAYEQEKLQNLKNKLDEKAKIYNKGIRINKK